MKIIVATGMLLLIVGAAVVVPRLETQVSATNETATSTPKAVAPEESPYPDEVLERAEREKERVLRLYELSEEKTLLQAEIDARKARISEIDKETGDY